MNNQNDSDTCAWIQEIYFQADLTYQVAQERGYSVTRLASVRYPGDKLPWTVRDREESPVPPAIPRSLPGNIITLPVRKPDSGAKESPSPPKGPAKVIVFPSHRNDARRSQPPLWPILGA